VGDGTQVDRNPKDLPPRWRWGDGTKVFKKVWEKKSNEAFQYQSMGTLGGGT